MQVCDSRALSESFNSRVTYTLPWIPSRRRTHKSHISTAFHGITIEDRGLRQVIQVSYRRCLAHLHKPGSGMFLNTHSPCSNMLLTRVLLIRVLCTHRTDLDAVTICAYKLVGEGGVGGTKSVGLRNVCQVSE